MLFLKSINKCDVIFSCHISTCAVCYSSAVILTCANDLLNLHTGHLDLFGKLTHSFIRVLVGEGVNVDLHSWRHLESEAKDVISTMSDLFATAGLGCYAL